MSGARTGRRAAIAAGLGAAAVLAVGIAYREDVECRYHLWRIGRDPGYMQRIRERPPGTPAWRAIVRHLRATLPAARGEHYLGIPDGDAGGDEVRGMRLTGTVKDATLERYLYARSVRETSREEVRGDFLYYVISGTLALEASKPGEQPVEVPVVDRYRAPLTAGMERR